VQLVRERVGGFVTTFFAFDQVGQSPSELVVVSCSSLVKDCDHSGIRHSLDGVDPNKRGFATHINDLFGQPVKALIVSRLIREYVCRGFELDRPELP
jgi:hypothetical protein